jgi:hypothetical protein
MLSAVWVAVVAAAAAFVAAAGVAVYVMLKAARLMSETSAAVAGLRQRGDLVIDRANAAIDQAGEQMARTETVTASMEGVTAAMAQLGGHLAATAPALPAADEGASGPLTWAAALVYGVRWALGAHRPGRDAPREAGGWPGYAGPRRRWPGLADRPRTQAGQPRTQGDRPRGQGERQGREARRRAAALTSRSNGTPR